MTQKLQNNKLEKTNLIQKLLKIKMSLQMALIIPIIKKLLQIVLKVIKIFKMVQLLLDLIIKHKKILQVKDFYIKKMMKMMKKNVTLMMTMIQLFQQSLQIHKNQYAKDLETQI